ncbi:hypothetical protein C0J52_08526 [Blattella germanica]|nr:hypothetical protein C0J52_08526 [Blattella germanica]
MKKFMMDIFGLQAKSKDRIDENEGETTFMNLPSVSSSISPSSSEATIREPLRIVGENIKFITDHLDCSVCSVDLMPPIWMCESGHSICSSCCDWISLCVICFSPITSTRNRNLEELANWAKYFCASYTRGCNARVPASLTKYHWRLCVYNIIRCPVRYIQDCNWVGTKLKAKNHIMKCHTNEICWEGVLKSKSLYNECIILFLDKEVFIFYKFFWDAIWICTLQKLGMTHNNYECVYKLHGNNNVDLVQMKQPVEVVPDSMSKFHRDDMNCRLPAAMMRHFVEGHEMSLQVTVRDVTLLKNP